MCAQQQSGFVLTENRVRKLGGFKRVLMELYKWIYELINYMNVPLKVLTVFKNDSMAFCFRHSLQVIPKGCVFNRNTALSTEFTGNSFNSAFPFKVPPAVREWIYRDLHSHPAGVQFLSGQKQTKFAYPAVDFEEKLAYVDSTHLNNSDKLPRIIYGADKIHIIMY